LVLHSSERPRALREVNPAVTASPELEALLFRSLEKQRANRFATARDFARALQEILPTLDDTPGAPPPLPKSLEVTEEPTRVAEETLKTLSLKTIEIATPPLPVEVPVELPPRRSSRAPLFTGLALLLALIAVGVVMMSRKPAPMPPQPARQVIASVIAPPGHIAI